MSVIREDMRKMITSILSGQLSTLKPATQYGTNYQFEETVCHQMVTPDTDLPHPLDRCRIEEEGADLSTIQARIPLAVICDWPDNFDTYRNYFLNTEEFDSSATGSKSRLLEFAEGLDPVLDDCLADIGDNLYGAITLGCFAQSMKEINSEHTLFVNNGLPPGMYTVRYVDVLLTYPVLRSGQREELSGLISNPRNVLRMLNQWGKDVYIFRHDMKADIEQSLIYIDVKRQDSKAKEKKGSTTSAATEVRGSKKGRGKVDEFKIEEVSR